MQLYTLPGVFFWGIVLEEAVTVDDRVFDWPLNFLKLPTLNLMITQIIIMLTARITTITTSPITDASSVMPNEEGTLVGISEALVTVVVTIAVTIDMVSVGILSLVVMILHSSMKS